MKANRIVSAIVGVVVVLIVSFIWGSATSAAPQVRTTSYKVLEPITQGNLTVFPVVSPSIYDTSRFITLDEGLRSGDVVVTEAGRSSGMIRRPGPRPIPQRESAEVNRLVLINNSNHPLILLAGEIVTGGKQDRVIGKDRVVPMQSDPIDLGVFCVEPGRWVASSDSFGSLSAQMAQPSVRAKAMADKDQGQVWAEVQRSARSMAAAAPAAAPRIASTTSYATVMKDEEVKSRVDEVAAKSYESIRRELRERNAVGVVVAVNGRLIWADIFASPALLEKYWPKLSRSYAAEAVTTDSAGRQDYPGKYALPDIADARDFLAAMDGEREVTETEPGVFRYTETTAPSFKVFLLKSLLPKTGFDLHVAKMQTGKSAAVIMRTPYR